MNTNYKTISLLAVFATLLGGCMPSQQPASPQKIEVADRGYASWYGGKFHGRKTASGEFYDQDKMTAAHKTLSFGTLVRVTNLTNGKNTIVKINDRGPFVKGRIIDLSREAARRIDMLTTGTAEVKLDILTETPANQGRFIIQTGSFSDQENAQMQKRDLSAKFSNLSVHIAQKKGLFRVHVGPYQTREMASRELSRIRKHNFDGIVLQL